TWPRSPKASRAPNSRSPRNRSPISRSMASTPPPASRRPEANLKANTKRPRKTPSRLPAGPGPRAPQARRANAPRLRHRRENRRRREVLKPSPTSTKRAAPDRAEGRRERGPSPARVLALVVWTRYRNERSPAPRRARPDWMRRGEGGQGRIRGRGDRGPAERDVPREAGQRPRGAGARSRQDAALQDPHPPWRSSSLRALSLRPGPRPHRLPAPLNTASLSAP